MNLQGYLDRLDQLLAEFEGLKRRAQYEDLSDLPEEIARLSVRLQAAFDRMTLPNDTFGKAAEALRAEEAHIRVRELAYLAYALRDEINAGWLRSISELVHADTSAEMVEMATDLLAAGYKDPAAVVSGTALELHLRALALKHGLDVLDMKGKPKKADTLRIELRQAQATSALQDKRVSYWLGVRNEAAHGNYGNYSSDDVRSLIGEVTQFIDQLPA